MQKQYLTVVKNFRANYTRLKGELNEAQEAVKDAEETPNFDKKRLSVLRRKRTLALKAWKESRNELFNYFRALKAQQKRKFIRNYGSL